MPLSFNDWAEIHNVIRKTVADTGEPFVQGKVIRNDLINKLVYLKEFGDTPIPLVAHHYQVKYLSRDSSGRIIILKTVAYSADVEVLVPKVGDIVLVAQHLGTRSLPKCLGVIMSRNYIQAD